MRCLIIEDNRQLAANLVDYLEACGHVVDYAADGVSGLHLAVTQPFDVLVLDLGLPGMDGMVLCERLREAGSDIPILVLTARDDLPSRVRGLDLGADDYLVKPVALPELEARLRAQVRRYQGRLRGERLQVGDLVLDEGTREASRAGRALVLTRIDFLLLRQLMRASPRVLTRQRLEEAIWGDAPPESDSLRAHVHRLRRVLDRPFPSPMLQTVHGVGYRLVAGGQDDLA